MKILHFVDAAGTDEHFCPVSTISQIEVTDNNTVKVLANRSGELTNDVYELTTGTGKSDEVALRLAQEIGANQIQYGGVLKVIAATAPFADVTVVGYTAGS